MVKANDLAKLVRSKGRKMMSGNYILEMVYTTDGHLYIAGKTYKCSDEKFLLKGGK
jgi:hypothetical protein